MVLESFCCGCTLRTGSLIIGYIYVVLNAIGAGYCIPGFLVLQFQSSSTYDQSPHNDLRGAFIVIGVICLQSLVINSLMVTGVHKGKPALVHLWLIVAGSGMVIQWTGILYIVIIVMVAGGGVGAVIGTVFGILCLFALQIYVLLVVLSHHQNMKKLSYDDEVNMI